MPGHNTARLAKHKGGLCLAARRARCARNCTRGGPHGGLPVSRVRGTTATVASTMSLAGMFRLSANDYPLMFLILTSEHVAKPRNPVMLSFAAAAGAPEKPNRASWGVQVGGPAVDWRHGILCCGVVVWSGLCAGEGATVGARELEAGAPRGCTVHRARGAHVISGQTSRSWPVHGWITSHWLPTYC